MKIMKIVCINFLIICTFTKTVLCFNAQNTGDFCNKNLCSPGQKHIGCNNNGALSPRCPREAEFIDLRNNRDMVICSHNEHRNMVALGKLKGFKPAVRMATMVWDDELTKLAEYNVKKCVFAHDECYHTKRFRNAGQCLAAEPYYIPDGFDMKKIIPRFMAGWFNEYNFTDMNMVENFVYDDNGIQQYGHFLELIVERNGHVGCAALQFNTPGYPDFSTVHVACNYGSVYNEPFVYEPGRAASKCETGPNPEFPGLCSKNEKINPNYYEHY